MNEYCYKVHLTFSPVPVKTALLFFCTLRFKPIVKTTIVKQYIYCTYIYTCIYCIYLNALESHNKQFSCCLNAIMSCPRDSRVTWQHGLDSVCLRHLKKREQSQLIVFQPAGLLLVYWLDWTLKQLHPPITNYRFTSVFLLFHFVFVLFCLYIYIHMYIYICIYICMYVCMYLCSKDLGLYFPAPESES